MPRRAKTRTVNIRELVTLLRSKNAGPAYFGFDLMFRDERGYEAAKRYITRDVIARLYAVPAEQVADLVPYDPGMGIKITIRRPVMSGDPDDTDVYGAQQHVPLMQHTVEWQEA
jgi:uncharacterized protein DUF4387